MHTLLIESFSIVTSLTLYFTVAGSYVYEDLAGLLAKYLNKAVVFCKLALVYILGNNSFDIVCKLPLILINPPTCSVIYGGS